MDTCCSVTDRQEDYGPRYLSPVFRQTAELRMFLGRRPLKSPRGCSVKERWFSGLWVPEDKLQQQRWATATMCWDKTQFVILHQTHGNLSARYNKHGNTDGDFSHWACLHRLIQTLGFKTRSITFKFCYFLPTFSVLFIYLFYLVYSNLGLITVMCVCVWTVNVRVYVGRQILHLLRYRCRSCCSSTRSRTQDE